MESSKQHQKMLENTVPSQTNQSSSESRNGNHLTDDHDAFFTGKRGYFFFPPEIRNEIMRLVLMPGDIYLKSSPIVGSSGSNYHRKKYGCQFLATCSRAYREGYELYYSFNTFHLPSGPEYWLRQVFQSVQPKHRVIIQYLAINCSVYDIHFPGTIQEIGDTADHILAPNHPDRNLGYDTQIIVSSYCESAGVTLFELWLKKFDCVRINFPGLKQLSVTFMDGDNPWLHQYFGLEPRLENLADHDQENRPSGQQAGQQAIDQDDKVFPVDTIHLSSYDLYLAWMREEIMKYYPSPFNPDSPLIKAAYLTRKRAENHIRGEFWQIDHAGEKVHRYQERMLLTKSSWATDRLNGKWPSSSTI